MSDQPTEKAINPEMLVGVSAVLIGVCALFVSLYETKLMREEQRAAVMPMLELSRSFYFEPDNEDTMDKWRLRLQTENVGIGPARIRDFRVTVDSEPKASWDEAMRALLNQDEPVTYGQSSINRRTVPPERMIVMFDLADRHLAPSIYKEFHRFDYEACYCSVFDECWTTSYSDFGAANEVEACFPDEDTFEE